MIVENVMFFVLGFLGAGLLAILIVPSVWRRAVRLTRRRIEAATPMTLNEFLADKDALRAEHAVATRRLERRLDALNARLASGAGALEEARARLLALSAERDALAVLETAHRARLAELESRPEIQQQIQEVAEEDEPLPDRPVAEDISLDALRAKTLAIETMTRRGWSTERFDPEDLRARLRTVAADVSRLVYAADAQDPDESLFDRVRRFAGAEEVVEEETPPPAEGGLSDRIRALEALQSR